MTKKHNKCCPSSSSSCPSSSSSCSSSSTVCCPPVVCTPTLIGGGWFNDLFSLAFVPEQPQYLSLWVPNLSPIGADGRIPSQTILTRSGVMRRLSVYIGELYGGIGAGNVGNQLKFTVFRNGQPTPLSTTYSVGASGIGAVNAGSYRVFNLNVAVEFLAGDQFSLQISVPQNYVNPPGFAFELEYHIKPDEEDDSNNNRRN